MHKKVKEHEEREQEIERTMFKNKEELHTTQLELQKVTEDRARMGKELEEVGEKYEGNLREKQELIRELAD